MSELHGEYVSAMFVFLKSSLLFEANNPAMMDACDRIAEASNSIWKRENGHAELRFRYDGIYVNQQFFVPPADKLEHCEYVCGVWRALNVAALDPSKQTDRAQWQELAKALRRFVRGESALPRMTDVIVQGLPLLPPRAEDEVGTGDARWELLQAYFFCVEAMRGLFARPGEPRQLVAVKRPLCKLLACPEGSRDLVLTLAFMRAGDAEHAVSTALVVGLMTRELGLTRKQSLELAMVGLLHGCERPVSEALQRQVELRQGRERNVLRMTLANEYRLWDSGSYPYNPSLASRLIDFAHGVRGGVSYGDLWRGFKQAAQ